MIDDWHGLYRKGWGDALVPEAFSHPAKYSFGLIEHIYQHMADEGWIEPGSVIVDPFGGIAGGAFHAMWHGCAWVGVELEARFVTLGNQNIDLWNSRYAPHFPVWGTARLIQGDSRKLLEVIGEAGAVVSSPPFGQQNQGGGISAALRNESDYPLYHRGLISTKWVGHSSLAFGYSNQGATPGNLGNMRGTADGLQAAVSSPPFEQAPSGGGISARMRGEGEYKLTTRLLRNLYQPSEQGNTDGQLANETGDDFWTAARQIVDQVYAALAPGGHAVWVVKHFVKNKQRIDFPGQWRQLCEAAGFVTVHEHRAWLVEDKGTQFTLDGNHHSRKVERKSFFRRLAENKGSPRIDWETVYCMEKRP